ncbi:MAG: TonB-dependent receptor [Candidatus Marinimicrobia bacterium]|nr:TonB-dependent receptor [Candidatus Neomarinimicrobiota bacterium]
MINRYLRLSFFTLFIIANLNAQSDRVAGKIRGRVVDANSNEALIGANIVVLPAGLGKGSATNMNGEYVIPNIPASTYDVRATYIGYSPQTIKGVSVFPGQTTTLNFKMSIQAIEGEIVEVVAEARKTIIAVRSPSAQKEITGEEIKRMPVTDFTDVLANSSGAIETEAGRARGIHIRGGRSGEVAFYVDGVNTNDPVNHGVGIEIDNNAIEQIVISTGGFSAEYGESMSGTVNIITKKGKRTKHSGHFEYETDRWMSGFEKDQGFGYDKCRASLNGPIPFTDGNMTYFLSTTYEDTDDRNPKPISQAHNGVKVPNGTGKLIYSPYNSPFKVTLSGSFSDKDELLYSHGISRGDWLRSYYNRKSGHSRLSLKLQSTISKNTAWELLVSYYNTYTRFSSGEGQNYKDFHYTSSRLDWVSNAISNEWYDTRNREWTPIEENNIPLIKDSFLMPDGTPLSSAGYEDQAFYYYYATKGYYDIETGAWKKGSYKAEAMNQRYHDAHLWYIPNELDPTSKWYDESDTTAHCKYFDRHEYADYLFMHPDSQVVHDLWSYNGNLHDGWTRDRDMFNVFTYGPGRPRYHDQDTKLYTAEFHLNSQVNLYNEAKFGWKLEAGDLHYVDIQFANKNPYFDSYDYRPMKGAAWLEDKFEYEDLIINIGARYDYFHAHANALWDPDNFDMGSDGLGDEDEPGYDPILNPDPNDDNYNADTNPTGTEGDGDVDYKRADAKHQISPRFGISFAVSDKTAMYANYGHFFLVPQYGEIYQNLSTDLTSGLPLVGNPDVDPEQTTAYEVGLKHRFTEDLGLEISAFYKDVENLLATRTYSTIFNGQVATVTFQEMEDYSKLKGVDIKLTMRNFYGLAGELSYSYLNAKGTGSSSREFYYLYIYETDRPLPSNEYPLEFDITHSFKGNLNYYIRPGQGPSIFGLRPFQNFNTNLQFVINSGAPYTPTDRYDKPQELGSKRMLGTSRFDMRIEKYIPIYKKTMFTIFADMRNIFNSLNTAWVYPYSGEPDDNGVPLVFERSRYYQYVGKTDPTTGHRINNPEEAYEAHKRLRKQFYNNPYNYGMPRIIRLGVSIIF